MNIFDEIPSATTTAEDVADQVADTTVDILQLLVGAAVGVFAALLVGIVLLGIGRALTRRRPSVKNFTKAVYKPAQSLLIVLGAWLGFIFASDHAVGFSGASAPAWITYLDHTFLILTIVTATWLVVGIVNGVTAAIQERIRESSERRAKRVQTQMQILHRVVIVVVWILGIAAVMLTFPSARTAGASLLASAGVVSVVAGLAAQTTLGNVFAGLQLAFSDSIRVGDIVFYNNSYSTVEEITLTYVVLAVWDGRRIIVPSSLLTTQSFENWTRRAPEMVGDVVIDVDWAVPVAAARKQLRVILMSTDLWDGKTGVLQVNDAVGGMVRIRAVVSAKNSPTLSDLKNYVREKLVVWIQHEAPQAIPHNYNWDYASFDFKQAEQRTIEAVDARLELAQPASYPPEVEKAASVDPRPSGAATRVLSAGEIQGLEQAAEGTDSIEADAEAGLAALAAGEDPATMRTWQPEASDKNSADPTLVMKLSDVEKLAREHKNTSESALFSGSEDADQRQRTFAGPGDDAYEDRKRQLERTTGSTPTQAASHPSESEPAPQEHQ